MVSSRTVQKIGLAIFLAKGGVEGAGRESAVEVAICNQ